MNVKTVRRIVRRINLEVKGSEQVTEELVRSIVEGGQFTPSHPVHQRIMAIYQEVTAK